MGLAPMQTSSAHEAFRSHADRTVPHGDDVIFVFGSNLAGRHGLGAALVARTRFGAVAGVGLGPAGRSYAIPTKSGDLKPLDLETIGRHITEFIKFAASRPDLEFFVTRVGCELAGYCDEQIAPLFRGATPNCNFAESWIRLLTPHPTVCRRLIL